MRTLEIANLGLRGGGGAFRAYGVIMSRRDAGIECFSLPLGIDSGTRGVYEKCPPVGFAAPRRILAPGFLPASIREVLFASLPGRVSLRIKVLRDLRDVDVVISHHEVADSLNASLAVSEDLGARRVAVLQLPPFYADRERISKIIGSYVLFYRLAMSPSPGIMDLARYAHQVSLKGFLENAAVKHRLERILRMFDLLIAVSRSIPLEMGWDRNVKALDPGVGFNPEELSYLRSLRARPPGAFKFHAIFSARLDAAKGLGDLLLAAKLIARSRRDFKLVITGSSIPRAMSMLHRAIRNLGLENTIFISGYVSRSELFEIKRSSKLMLYPSHVDAYPYSVLENLILSRPVVAYDIPALKVNYEDLEGVYLVKEGDIEALAQKVLEVLEARNVEVDEPRVKLFREVAAEEIEMIRKSLKI